MKKLGAMILLCWPLWSAAAERAVDVAKSEIGFSVKQMGVAVTGVFKMYQAKINWDAAAPDKSSADIVIETASLSTGEVEADDIAREKAWLDAMGFPQASFRSAGIKALGSGRYEARGPLRIKGKSRELVVPFTMTPTPDGSAAVTGQFKLLRADFGIGGGEWNEGDLVSPDVELRFKLLLKP